MEQLAVDEHMKALEKWNEMKDAPTSPQQFHQ